MDGSSCSAGRGTDVSAAVGSSPEKSQPPWESWRDVVVLSEEGRASGVLRVTKGNGLCSPAHWAIVSVPSARGS